MCYSWNHQFSIAVSRHVDFPLIRVINVFTLIWILHVHIKTWRAEAVNPLASGSSLEITSHNSYLYNASIWYCYTMLMSIRPLWTLAISQNRNRSGTDDGNRSFYFILQVAISSLYACMFSNGRFEITNCIYLRITNEPSIFIITQIN